MHKLHIWLLWLLYGGKYSREWIEDSLHWRGRLLTGKFGHWCPEWDALPIDETCDEWEPGHNKCIDCGYTPKKG